MLKMQIKLYIFRYLYLINGTVHCSVLKMGGKLQMENTDKSWNAN